MPSSYTYTPDGNGGWTAQAVPVTGVLHTAEGQPTSVKVDAAGNKIVQSEEQLAVLAQLDAPHERPSDIKAYQLATIQAQLAKSAPEGLSSADAARDAAAARLVGSMQAQGRTDDATVTPAEAPKSAAEREERLAAAARLAAALGYQLVMVNDDPVMKVPPHLEVRSCGMPYAAGPLEMIESRLAVDARQRTARDRAIALVESAAARRAQVQAEALASSPAARLARLEAQNAELLARLAQTA